MRHLFPTHKNAEIQIPYNIYYIMYARTLYNIYCKEFYVYLLKTRIMHLRAYLFLQ